MSSTLLALSAEIKSYRIATYAYRLAILDLVMTMIDKIVTVTLVLKDVLKKILESIATHQTKAKDRLTSAIKPSQILSYYETKLLTNVVVDDFGMVFRIAIPFASGSTALNLYRAITIPMPTNDTNGYASQYETEGQPRRRTQKIALLYQPEIDA